MISVPIIQTVMRVCCALILIGLGWLCLQGIMPWPSDSDFVADSVVVTIGIAQGIVFLVSAILVSIRSRNKWFNRSYILISCNLIVFCFLKYLNAQSGIGHFLEHAAQFCSPFLLFLIVRESPSNSNENFAPGSKWGRVAVASISSAFIFHGLLAMDIPHSIQFFDHQRPQHFNDMVRLCLPLSEQVANLFLVTVGVLDILAVIVLVFAVQYWKRIALQYMCFWGFATSLARPWSFFDASNIGMSIHRWLPEMLLRSPHFLLPLCLLIILKKRP